MTASAQETGVSVVLKPAGASLATEEANLEGSACRVATSCELALALGVVQQPGGLSPRDAMLCAVARAWPDDPAGD